MQYKFICILGNSSCIMKNFSLQRSKSWSTNTLHCRWTVETTKPCQKSWLRFNANWISTKTKIHNRVLVWDYHENVQVKFQSTYDKMTIIIFKLKFLNEKGVFLVKFENKHWNHAYFYGSNYIKRIIKWCLISRIT